MHVHVTDLMHRSFCFSNKSKFRIKREEQWQSVPSEHFWQMCLGWIVIDLWAIDDLVMAPTLVAAPSRAQQGLQRGIEGPELSCVTVGRDPAERHRA